MIEVRYRGGLGNNLFQYCFGRALATSLGWALRAPPIDGFPGTRTPVDGTTLQGEPRFLIWQEDVCSLVKDPGNQPIVAYGYFQKYSNIRLFKDSIRTEWLVPQLGQIFAFEEGDLAIHVRLGDYVRMGHALPKNYYLDAIHLIRPKRVILFSDEPASRFHEVFRGTTTIRVQADSWDTFSSLVCAPKLVISQSTFSWWAAYLSNAHQIIAPIPYWGFWSDQHPAIQLTVDDEPRYHYLKCRPSPWDWVRLQYWKYRKTRSTSAQRKH